jgi:hypothetical protein
VLNLSDRRRGYFRGEVPAVVLAGGLTLLGALSLVTHFIQAQGSSVWATNWLVLNSSPTLAVLLISVPLGFLYGQLSRSTRVEAELTLAEAYRLLNDIATRQVQSGNPAHVNLISALAYETEVARQKATSIRDKIWRIQSQFDSVKLQQQLASAIGARYLHAWFDNEQPPTVGRETIINFRIEPFQDIRDSNINVANAEETLLLIHVVSNSVEVKDMPMSIVLPETGSSTLGRASIVPRKDGQCELTFFILADQTLEVLQTYTTTIEARRADGHEE